MNDPICVGVVRCLPVRGVRLDGRRRSEEILDAALDCFAKRGVVATRVQHIRAKANASPSSVYHLFGGLEEILFALLERTFARLFGHLAERVAPARSAEAAVTALVGAHLEWVLANRAEARVMYQAMSLEASAEVTSRLARRKAELLAPLAARLGRFVADGSLPPWPPPLLDVVILGSTHEACRRFLAGAAIDPAWMAQALPRLAWESLRAGARAKTRPTKARRSPARRSR